MTEVGEDAVPAKGGSESGRGAWIGALFVLALLVLCYGPILGAEPGFQDAELHSGELVFDGWLPSTVLSRFELSTGASLAVHRALALAAQALVLLCVPFVLRAGRFATSVLLVPLTVLFLHPAHTETGFRLALRPTLGSELLVLAGLGLHVLCRERRDALGRGGATAACLMAAAGAAGVPSAAALALPLFLVGRSRDPFLALSLLGGAAVQFVVSRSALGAIDLPRFATLWRTALDPSSVGVIQPVPHQPLLFVALALLPLVLVAFAGPERRRSVGGLAVAASIAAVLALRLPPVRPEQEFAGALTPDAAVVPAVLWIAALVSLGRGPRGFWLAPALGVVLFVLGWPRQRAFDSVDQYFVAALEVDPERAVLHRLHGESILARMERIAPGERAERAEEAYQCSVRARRAGEDSVAVDRLEITALAWMGRADTARRKLEALLAARPDDVSLLLLRGDVELLDERVLDALQWYRRARSSAVEVPLARARYARALERCYQRIQRGLSEGAIADVRRMCEMLLEVAPEEREAAELRAQTFVEEGRDDEAVTAFEEVHARFPQSQFALRALITLHEHYGRTERAQELRRELLRIGGMQAFE